MPTVEFEHEDSRDKPMLVISADSHTAHQLVIFKIRNQALSFHQTEIELHLVLNVLRAYPINQERTPTSMRSQLGQSSEKQGLTFATRDYAH
jgi:hypothetical protein